MRAVSFDTVKMPPARRDPTATAAIAEVMAEQRHKSPKRVEEKMKCAMRPREIRGWHHKRPTSNPNDHSCLSCEFYCYWDVQGTELGCKNWLRPDYRQRPTENTCKCWRLARDISAADNVAGGKPVCESSVYESAVSVNSAVSVEPAVTAEPAASTDPANENGKTR